MPGGRLPETENKRIYQISGPKSGRGRFGNLGSCRLRESFWNSVWLRNKRIICEVVAYGRWSLARSGRYERGDCTKMLLILYLFSYCTVNGGWSSWFVFTPCSVSCGTGMTVLARTCTNPAPKYGGRPCQGPARKGQPCLTKACPSKLWS